ncbi:hypothetical protein N1851_020553 [Merluccius polli]|uniref:Uncharacterized protein n=1 Tax=Merluccius polli TaxID=89951 RepID=A0AA47MKG8_MERPO|nr:hypothetical protein N1851_020553 [Merluccius polli]
MEKEALAGWNQQAHHHQTQVEAVRQSPEPSQRGASDVSSTSSSCHQSQEHHTDERRGEELDVKPMAEFSGEGEGH